MIKLEELVRKYCPNGVHFLAISKCTTKISTVKWLKEDGTKYQYIDLGSVDRETHTISETQTICAENAPSRAQQIVFAGDVILGTTRPLLKRYCIIPNKYTGQICSTGFCVLRANENIVLNKWLYHQISSTDFFDYVEKHQQGTSYPSISDIDVKNFCIPVPPIEVQREIIRILDSFADLTSKLTESLSMELTARKQQYMYYRDILLNFDPGIKQVKLGDICSLITKGTTPKRFVNQGVSFVKTEAIDGSKIILDKLSYIDEETHTSILKRSILEENDILITIAGATIGKCLIVPPEILPANTNQALAIVRLAKGNSPRYILHLLQSGLMKKYIKENIKGSAQPNLTLKQLNDFVIPLPTLSVQQRLVEVLDNFDAICSDLNIGLPAEIEARKKQYEFYRDQLLTFAAQDEIVLTDRQTDRQTSITP